MQQALDALSENRTQEAMLRLTEVDSRLADAIQLNARLARAYELRAQAYTLRGEYASAISLINDAMAQLPELSDDVALILARGQAYFAEGQALIARGSTENGFAQLERAEYEAYLALHLNPYDETAHQLHIEAALARNNPGLAVLHVQTYLLYLPDNPNALRLLGDARMAEGNTDLAFDAYSLALADSDDAAPAQLIEILLSRAELFNQQRRYDLALADYTRAWELSDDLTILAHRMPTAYAAGDLDLALQDLAALSDTGIVPTSQLQLMQAQIMIDRARPRDPAIYTEALSLLDGVDDAALPAHLRGVANEYRARAHLQLEAYDDALTAINAALAAGESGTRRYLRAQVLMAQAQPVAALRDFDWLLAWDNVYAFSFAEQLYASIAEAQAALEGGESDADADTDSDDSAES